MIPKHKWALVRREPPTHQIMDVDPHFPQLRVQVRLVRPGRFEVVMQNADTKKEIGIAPFKSGKRKGFVRTFTLPYAKEKAVRLMGHPPFLRALGFTLPEETP